MRFILACQTRLQDLSVDSVELVREKTCDTAKRFTWLKHKLKKRFIFHVFSVKSSTAMKGTSLTYNHTEKINMFLFVVLL